MKLPSALDFFKDFKLRIDTKQYESGEEAQAISLISYYAKETIEALEKQTPQKPTRSESIIEVYSCPRCSTPEKFVPVFPILKYCSECGQRLDWSAD